MLVDVARNSAAERPFLGDRERRFASLVWRHGQLSRREIQQRTGVHPTLTGNSVSLLIQSGLLREAKIAPTVSRGRPQIPLELDPGRCVFLGMAIAPGNVRVARLDPTGRQHGKDDVRRIPRSASVIDAACAALGEHLDSSVHSIGVSFTGLMDVASRQILFSSAQPSKSSVSLQPIFDKAGNRPVILDNDMHALAMRWLLQSSAPAGDVLLVGVDDCRLGSAVLIDGKPQRGRVSAANELGHTRLAIDSDECFCGQRGCLERIVSTQQLARFGGKTGRSLDDVLAEPGRDRAAVNQLLDYLVLGLANAVNFIFPEKLVISSPFARHPLFREVVQRKLPEMILPGLRQRVETIFWEQANMQSADNAAWLALADVFGHSFGNSEA